MENFQQQLPYYPYNNVYRFNIFLHKVFVRVQELLLTVKNQIEDNVNTYNITAQNNTIQNTNDTYNSITTKISESNTFGTNASTSELLTFYQMQYTKINELTTLIQNELQPLIDIALIESTIEQTQFMYVILKHYLRIVEEIQQHNNNTVLKDNPNVLQEIQYMIRKIQIKLDEVLQNVIRFQNKHKTLTIDLNVQNN